MFWDPLLCLLASGCVYRINIQQGNFLNQSAVDTIKAGMTRSQVRYLLGTPMVADSFDKERWDYIYYLKNGRTRHVDSRRVTVYFDGDKVATTGQAHGCGSRRPGCLGREDQERPDLLTRCARALAGRPWAPRAAAGKSRSDPRP